MQPFRGEQPQAPAEGSFLTPSRTPDLPVAYQATPERGRADFGSLLSRIVGGSEPEGTKFGSEADAVKFRDTLVWSAQFQLEQAGCRVVPHAHGLLVERGSDGRVKGAVVAVPAGEGDLSASHLYLAGALRGQLTAHRDSSMVDVVVATTGRVPSTIGDAATKANLDLVRLNSSSPQQAGAELANHLLA